MTPVQEKALMIIGDLVSSAVIDIAFRAQSEGKDTITVDELLTEAGKWKALRASEAQKVKDRIKDG